MRKFLIISVLIGGFTHGQKNSQSEYLTNILRSSDSAVNKNAIESVPRRLSYQGLLTKANGQAVGTGSYQITFKLFRESIGGTAFWEETQNIDVSDGVINATLGVVNQINNVPSSSYLEIMVNETTLSPRQEMTSVFYSVVSDTAKYSQAGNYTDLDNRPDLSIYAKEDTLSTYVKNSSLDTVAFTGSYNDLSDLPDFSEIINFDTLGYYVMSDSLSSYVLTSELASVAISNSYNDLSGLPDLGQYATLDTLGNFVLTDSIGTIAKQNSNNVDITGGSISGVSDIAIADGGTGASDNSTARSNLGLEIGVDIQAFDADLADLADGLLTGNKVEYLENVTSDVQAQIDSIGIKSLEDLGITADSTELNYVDGVTSNIQDQLDLKQGLNANLSTLAELEQNHDHFIVSDGTSWVTKEGSNARTSLGLGSISTQASDDVLITGGSVTGIDDIGVADGGTGASDISTARTNLGLEIGVDIQGYDADLTDLSDGTLSASKIEFLQGVTSDVQVQLDSKGSGTVSTLTDLGVTATATELNYVDGVSSNMQDQLDSKVDSNVNLTTLSGLGHTDGNFLVSDGSSWTVESGSDARTSLGLGSIATQAANNVTISGGAITGVTDIAVADGGTGASDIASARTNLGLDIGVDIQAYDADLADLADGELSASKVQYAITTEGTSGQIWTSDGSGAGAWVTSSAATSINGLSDALVEDTGSMYIGNDPSSSTDGANYNIAVGTTALDAVTTGYSNTAIGYNALTENLSANRNTAVGSNALKSNTTGIANVAVGSSALERNTTANRNTAVGHASSYLLNSGQNNVSMGYESSKNMTSANNNVIIGSGANPSADTGTSNQVAIGYGVTGVANNSITLGNSDVTAVYMAQDEGATVYGAIFKGSTSIQTPLIEYTDGDDALTIADGGALTTSGNLSVGGSNNELRFYEGSNYVGFEAPSLSADQVWSLPTADGSANQVLKTDGSGALAWTDVSATIVTVSDNENTSETNALVFTSGGDVDGGSMGLESDGDATYNPSTGVIGSTGFSGATVLASTSVDITGSAGLILENDEKITNSIDGTVLINGVVAGGTGSAAGVFASNGDNDITIKTGNSNTGTITITDGANENISIAPNGTGKTDFNDSPLTGYGADLQTESGTSKTLAAADNGTIIVCSSNSAVTITVPASLPTGFNCMIIQSGSGQVSLSASSTTLNNRNGTKTAGQHAIMTVVHLGSDAFVVSGDVTS